MYPGYDDPHNMGMAPGFMPPPPTLYGATMGGLSNPSMHQTGAHLAGSYAASTVGGIPTGFATGVMGLSMVAAMGGMGAMQSRGLLDAGYKGFGAVPGMLGNVAERGGIRSLGIRGTMGAMAGGLGRQAGYGLMAGATALDPTSYIMQAGRVGMNTGLATGQSMFGTTTAARLAGASRAPIAFGYGGGLRAAGQTTMHAFRNQGMRAGLGMAARFGGSAMMGAGGAALGAAGPLALAYGAYKGLEYGGKQIYGGYQDTMMGQALMNDMGSQIAPGQSMQGEGATTGAMMRDMADSMGMEMQDIGRLAKQLGDQKVFQTTRSAKEFREKFKKVMGAVTEIAQITKSSVDDAAKMFGDLRQQGFYTTADIKAQAAQRQAREMTTGISAGVYSAIGGVGAQTARAMGMRGRYGSRHMERSVAGVSMGVRSGAMSEEEVMEMGGVEQVGMRLAQQQMGFLGTARGRAMIAYSMGQGGAPDPSRLQRMIGGGMSIEELVTGAAGRGLGVLQQAGSRESKEQMMQYAGMGMISMAAMQQKQLTGGSSYQGIIRHLGTMGVGREEAKVMYAQAMQMPEQLRAEQTAREDEEEERRYQGLVNEQRIGTRLSRSLRRNFGRGLRGFGRSVGQETANYYSRAMDTLSGGEVYDEGGDEELARQARREGIRSTLGRGRRERRTPFGLTSSSGRIQSQTFSARGRSDFRMSDEDFQAALDSGEIVDLGEGALRGFGRGMVFGATLGTSGREASGRYARRSELEGENRGYMRGYQGGMSSEQVNALRLGLMRGEGGSTGRVGNMLSYGAAGAAGGAALGSVATPIGTAGGAAAGFVGGAVAGAVLDTSGLAKARSRNIGGAQGAGVAGTAGALAMNLGLASFDLTGTLGKLQSQSDTFSLAQSAGIISKDTNFRDWARSTSAADKAKLEGQIRAGLEVAAAKGDPEAQATLESYPQREVGLLQVRDVQAMRDDFATQMQDKLTGEFGHWLGGLRGKGNQKTLSALISKDSGARQKYSELMEALANGDPDAIDKLDAFAAETGGKESAVFKAAKSQFLQVQGMSEEERAQFRKSWAEGGGKLLKDRALAEHTFRGNKELRGRLSKLSNDAKQDPRVQDFIRAMGMEGGAGGTLDPTRRALAMQGLFGDVMKGGLDDKEVALLNQLSPGAGTGLGNLVGELSTTEGDVSDATVKQFQKLLGTGGKEMSAEQVKERLRGIRAQKGESQNDAIMQLLSDAGITDLSSFGMAPGGGKSRRGVQESYIAANEKFVQAVMAFVAGMKNVKGAPKFEANEVDERAEDVLAEGNGVDTGTGDQAEA